MNDPGTVFIVDDDEAVRESLSRLVLSAGLRVETYPSAGHFLVHYDRSRGGCLILDIRMKGMTGLELQEELGRLQIRIPVIIISAHGTVDSAVQAMKAGALDFFKKPYDSRLLLECVRRAVAADAEARREESRRRDALAKLELLTPRELEVMKLMVSGQSTKQIAVALRINRRTVDVHKGRVMTKLCIDSVVELAELAATAGDATERFGT